jgi:aminoglycoside/choline kinase family phosphotransferase
VNALSRELAGLIPRLLAEPRVLVHRDLQSTNVLFRRGAPCLIDFQGMRFGPAAYDLASLLCDPYVSLAAPVMRELLAYYGQLTGVSTARLEPAFWLAAVQRLVQALGAYARLGAGEGTARFAAHIVPGLRMLCRALDNGPDLPGLRRAVNDLMREEEAP